LPRFAALHGCTKYDASDVLSCIATSQPRFSLYTNKGTPRARPQIDLPSRLLAALLPCCPVLHPCLQIELECLNSIAPPPLNWHMWCPGKDATVKGWTDKSGAAHRSITLRPQKNMTSTMITWFITTHVLGLMPPVVEHQGNVSDAHCCCCCLLLLLLLVHVSWCVVCCVSRFAGEYIWACRVSMCSPTATCTST
jgi:hypothetical protein